MLNFWENGNLREVFSFFPHLGHIFYFSSLGILSEVKYGKEVNLQLEHVLLPLWNPSVSRPSCDLFCKNKQHDQMMKITVTFSYQFTITCFWCWHDWSENCWNFFVITIQIFNVKKPNLVQFSLLQGILQDLRSHKTSEWINQLEPISPSFFQPFLVAVRHHFLLLDLPHWHVIAVYSW